MAEGEKSGLAPGTPEQRRAHQTKLRRLPLLLAAVLASAALVSIRNGGWHAKAANLSTPYVEPDADDDASGWTNCVSSDSSGYVMAGCDVLDYARLSNHSSDGLVYPNCTMGSADFESTQEGYSFLFASAENLALFEANPTAYYPMYGGFCAYGMACEEWWTISDMAADANPNVWAVIDDRLFTFRGEDPYQKFMVNKTANIIAGDARWTLWLETMDATAAFNTKCFHYGM